MSTDETTLINDYADLGVACGYIGNVYPGCDDRSFRVFTKLARDSCSLSSDVNIRVFDVPRGIALWTDKVAFDTPEVRAELDSIRAKLEAGELHYISGWRP